MASRLIWKCWIRWRCSRYLFWLKSTRFRQIWFKKTCLFYRTVYFPVSDKNTFLGKFIPKYQNYNFQPQYVMFTKLNGFLGKVDLTWSTFKICQIFLFFFINQFIRLIASIYQQQVDYIILFNNTPPPPPPKIKMFMFNFPT